MNDLDGNELGWLLGLAAAKRRKREGELRLMRRKPGQGAVEFEEALERMRQTITFYRSVEDKLIVACGDDDVGLLKRPDQRARYRQLQAAEA